jgi:predicted DNA-binding WGR domain protein
MNPVVLYRIDRAKHMHRYYRMDVQPDLFGAWCLMREWGGIGRAGQTRCVSFPTWTEAEAALERQHRAKQRRGYHCQD